MSRIGIGGNRSQRQKTEGKEKEKEQRRKGRDVCPGGTKGCPWIESRQTYPVGKRQFLRGEKGIPVLG